MADNKLVKVVKANGRPRVELDWEQIILFCEHQCTHEEIAHFCRCDVDTVHAACLRDNNMSFSEFYKKHSSVGKSSLRHWMFQNAKKGNATMQIWLSKQHLGMRDNLDQTNKILDADKIVFKISWQDEDDEQRDRAENAQANGAAKVTPPI